MRKAGLSISAGWLDEDDMGYFTIVATNGRHATSIEIFEQTDSFRKFGSALAEFPRSEREVVTFNGGAFGLDRQRGTWLTMRGYCYDAGGQSALEIDANHLQKLPGSFRSWFSIRAEVASLNKLGQLLRQWQPAQQPLVSWDAYMG